MAALLLSCSIHICEHQYLNVISLITKEAVPSKFAQFDILFGMGKYLKIGNILLVCFALKTIFHELVLKCKNIILINIAKCMLLIKGIGRVK